MSDVFTGGGGAGGIFAGLGSPSGGYSGSGVDVEGLERTGRRMTALQRYAPEFVTASPASALALAEGGFDDDEILRSASESVSFANVERLRSDLDEEDDKVSRAMWLNLPSSMQKSLRDLGYEPPEERKQGGGRWGINLPDFLPGPNELTIARSTPVLGPIGNVQAGIGEALEGSRGVTGDVLDAFSWIGEQPAHLYRSWKYIQENKSAGGGPNAAGFFGSAITPYFSPAQVSHAWGETDKEDGYVRPQFEERARKLLGGDEQLATLARGIAFGKTPEEIVTEAGFEPGSAEAGQMVMQLGQSQADPDFREAVRAYSTGQVSFGRTVTQGLGLDDTDAGWGRLVSGTLDAGFMLTSDPTLALGKVTKAARFGRWAFALEDAQDVGRGFKLVDAAMEANKLRKGIEVGEAVGKFGVRDMRRGRATLAWADRVAEGFSTGQLSRLMRDMPNVSTALDTMVNSHSRRLADGLQGLDETEGVLQWLKDRDGILALAGSRLGGGSPLVRGLRIPALTTTQRAAMATKGIWTEALDWSRMQYGPGLARMVSEVGTPQLARSLGQWAVAHTAGDTGRFLSALTTHAPYKNFLPLYGDEAVSEFGRLANSGMFTGMSRSSMDDYVSAFAKADPVGRSTQVEQFLRKLFDDAGIADTDFAKRFVGRHHQMYATAGGDEQFVDSLATRGARLVDAQHGDAMAIPNLRDFLRQSRKTNVTRFIFHNTPSSWADAALGRAWKPAVLMRIGFIPRAAGEELLHYALKHGPRTWIGAKGADWAFQEVQRVGWENDLREAVALGDTVKAEQLRTAMARTTSALAPVRGLMAASDRMWSRAWAGTMERMGVEETQGWRSRLITKVHNLDEKGTVTGLERFANQLSLRASGVLHWAADKSHIPTKGEVGEFLANRWNPDAMFAARLFIDDPVVARAYAEQISGSTWTPDEFRGLVDDDGVPLRKVHVTELRAGRPVLTEVELRAVPGEHQTLSRAVEQDPTFLDSIYSRHQALIRGDRVGEAVTKVLPRWTGGEIGELPARLGHADTSSLRGALNDAWAHAPEEEGALDGPSLLRVVRDYVDGEDFEPARRGWLAKTLSTHFRSAGVKLNGKQFLKTLDEAGGPAKHWLLYENVHPDWLTDNFEQLLRQMRHAGRARLARPDMYRHLRENRLYQLGDEPLARPVVNGISKVYVPVTPEETGALGEAFVESAVAHIKRIGGYGEERARLIASRVAQSSDTEKLRMAAAEMVNQKPIAAWGSADPRVAEAVMAAVEETTGVRPTFGILEVPDEAMRRAVSRHPQGIASDAEHWKIADDYEVEPWRLMKTTPVSHTRRLTQLEVDGDWWDEVELSLARQAQDASRPGFKRLYTTNRRIWSGEAPEDKAFWFVDVPDDVPETAPLDVIESFGPHKLPAGANGQGWEPEVVGHQFSEGLPEIAAIDRVSDGAVDEALDILTTRNRADLDDDVLHEVVEPALRGDKVYVDEAGNKVTEPGYQFDHLVYGTKVDRLPWESYGPTYATARDSTWSKFVSEWFAGPVDHAISAVIRKPMFLTTFGEQLRYSRGVADLFVEPEVHAAAARAAKALGLDADALDTVVLNSGHTKVEEILTDMVGGDPRREKVLLSGLHGDRWYDAEEFDATMRALRDGPPEGYVRLYRGEATDSSGRSLKSSSGTYGSHRASTSGLWFTDDPRYADTYARERAADFAGPEVDLTRVRSDLRFVDIPEAEALQHRVDQLGPEYHAMAGGPRTDEYVLPPKLAQTPHRFPSEYVDRFAKGDVWSGGGPEILRREPGMPAGDLGAISDFVAQRQHGLEVVRQNALNRAMQLTIPFIDDHRVRSQFQNYVGNFVPFLFAEEQFLKRWARSVAESPEMIRRAQLTMNGLRSMGVVRKDAHGQEVFVYPGAGEATKVLSDLAAPIFGDNLRVPYVVEMTGQVGYALPGLGDQTGVPSVGPLVAMPLEFLSRHFPELNDYEHQLVGRGADQPLWRYIVPSGGAKLVDAMFGDIDSGQLASATSQAMLTMAVNGQAPAEGATPAERQEFIEKARGQARFILATRAVFGMNAPASPQVSFRSDELNDEFNKLLAAAPIEEAVQTFLATHPDTDAKDILAATVPVTEQSFGGLDMPTEVAANWMDDNQPLIGGFPAAASWLIPRAKGDDKFSYRGWTQQFALGLRRRKAPEELLNDVYFQAASRDYFDERTAHEARLLTSLGPERNAELANWDRWKGAYFSQHPVFEAMLADPTRLQHRAQAVDELGILSADPHGPVPPELAELIQRYQEYRAATSAMRGDRRSGVERRRRSMTEEFATWALWQIDKYPSLSAAYMRLIEPDLEEWDQDAVTPGAVSRV